MNKRTAARLKIAAIRWWVSGVACFLVAFGTGFGVFSPLDMLALLSAVIATITVLLLNPAILMIFPVYRAGRMINNEYKASRWGQKIAWNIREILKCYIIIFLVFFLYQVLNTVLIAILGRSPEEVVLPLEPILFGVFYTLIYEMLSSLTDSVVLLCQRRWRKG